MEALLWLFFALTVWAAFSCVYHLYRENYNSVGGTVCGMLIFLVGVMIVPSELDWYAKVAIALPLSALGLYAAGRLFPRSGQEQ